jgi:hypothetical protein
MVGFCLLQHENFAKCCETKVNMGLYGCKCNKHENFTEKNIESYFIDVNHVA